MQTHEVAGYNSEMTGFRFNLDNIPIQIGHRSDLIWTAFRELFGQFLGAVGTVSKMEWNATVGVR